MYFRFRLRPHARSRHQRYAQTLTQGNVAKLKATKSSAPQLAAPVARPVFLTMNQAFNTVIPVHVEGKNLGTNRPLPLAGLTVYQNFPGHRKYRGQYEIVPRRGCRAENQLQSAG